MQRITSCDGLAETDICKTCERGEGACENCDFQKVYDKCFNMENDAERQFILELGSGAIVLSDVEIAGLPLRAVIIRGSHEQFILEYLDEHACIRINGYEIDALSVWKVFTYVVRSRVFTQLIVKVG